MYRFVIKKPYVNLLLRLESPKTMGECAKESGMTYNHLCHVLRAWQQQAVIRREISKNSNEKIIHLTDKGQGIRKALFTLTQAIDVKAKPISDMPVQDNSSTSGPTTPDKKTQARDKLLTTSMDNLKQIAKENEIPYDLNTKKTELVEAILTEAEKQNQKVKSNPPSQPGDAPTPGEENK